MAQPKASAIFYDLAFFYSSWEGGGKVPPLYRHSVPFMDGFERGELLWNVYRLPAAFLPPDFYLMDNMGAGVFGQLGIFDRGETEALGAVGTPHRAEKFLFGTGKEGVLGGVQRAVNDNEGVISCVEGLSHELIRTVFVVSEESCHEDLL